MRYLLLSLISLFFVTAVQAGTGLETGKGDSGKYLYSPFGESELSAVLSITQMEYDTDIGTADGEFSFGLGLNVEIGQGPMKWVTGLHYIIFKSEDDLNDELELTYLMIPLAMKYYTAGAESGLYLKGGINPMILIDDEINGSSVVGDTNDINFLLNVGLGYRISSGTNDLNLELSYNQGLNDVYDASVDNISKGFIFSAGINF